jgi:hypothetical protein
MAEALVTSENVGEGGPGDSGRLLKPNVSVLNDRGRLGAMLERSVVSG